MTDKDNKFILDLAQQIDRVSKKLDDMYLFFTQRINAVENASVPIRKEEYKVQGYISDPAQIDILAKELKPILAKYKVKSLSISLV